MNNFYIKKYFRLNEMNIAFSTQSTFQRRKKKKNKRDVASS